MPSRILGIALGLGVALSVGTAQAQDAAPGSVKGIPVVVELRGKRKHGADRLSRTLRRKLADALGGLRSSRALHREQDRLEIPKRERTKPSQLAEAGRGVAADYLVFVRVNRKRRANYEAKGYLISTEDGRIAAKHTERFTRPSKEAGPAGDRLATAMLAALGKIQAEKAPPPPPPVASNAPPPPPPALLQDGAMPSMPDSPAPKPDTPPTAAATPVASTPLPTTTPAPAEPPAVETPAPTTPRRRGPIAVRVGVGGGAGLVRSYRISADDVRASDLSHSLSPQGMARLAAEIELTRIGLGVVAQASLRPVGYNVVVDEVDHDLSGMLLDAQVAFRYHLALSERDGLPVQLVPALGMRVSRSSVEAHTPDVIPNATLISPFLRIGGRLPYDAKLELEGGIDLGLVAAYSESPVTTGDAPGGITFGADVGLRYWIGPRIGVAFDTRFTIDRLSFSDFPTRAVTRNEQAGLQNVNLSIFDARAALSMLLRF